MSQFLRMNYAAVTVNFFIMPFAWFLSRYYFKVTLG